MPGKLIIIEAGDGSGKATQTEKLYLRLQKEGKRVKKVEFPDYRSPSSALIKMYLNGEFGSQPGDVSPYVASTFYAVDRYASFKKDWQDFYYSGGIILADRYTTSNMVHQAVKIPGDADKQKFLEWLWNFEFQLFQLPVPDCVLFLDVPPEYSRKLIRERANKSGEGQPDIHERDEDYLSRCYASYRLVAAKYCWQTISCTENGRLKSIDEIHAAIYDAVKRMVDL
ncbi:thymidylate kinase [Lucifera butyrica]|uniref:Thymidylate kinase n=1 Tax=Lucifera butyrica TaxID=1351585 RepID=A0A498R601_9FIRM|nr:thymidylate kinase [Lucifera butyrica]VBB06589.1 thymidylate kinase [Lucifera butyrica]